MSLSITHLHRRQSGASPSALTAAGAKPPCRATDPAERISPARCLQKAPCDKYAASGDPVMATMTIHNLDDGLKLRLRVRAAMHGRSVEEEACEILRRAIGGVHSPRDIASGVGTRIANPDRVNLHLAAREAIRDPSPLGTQESSRRAGSR